MVEPAAIIQQQRSNCSIRSPRPILQCTRIHTQTEICLPSCRARAPPILSRAPAGLRPAVARTHPAGSASEREKETETERGRRKRWKQQQQQSRRRHWQQRERWLLLRLCRVWRGGGAPGPCGAAGGAPR